MSGKDNFTTSNQEFKISTETNDGFESETQAASQSILQENTFADQDTLSKSLNTNLTKQLSKVFSELTEHTANRVNTLLEDIPKVVADDATSISYAARSSESLKDYIDQINEGDDISLALLKSQATFAAVLDPSIINDELWKYNAIHYIGFLMGTGGKDRHGNVKLGKLNYNNALCGFIAKHISPEMDYNGVLSALLEDFNRLANLGYSKIISLVLKDLVLASIQFDEELNIGHKRAWHTVLQELAQHRRAVTSNFDEGWPYEPSFTVNTLENFDDVPNVWRADSSQININDLENYVAPEARLYDNVTLSADQVASLLYDDSFLPEHLSANRLLRNMFKVEGHARKVAVHIINYLACEQENLDKFKDANLFTRAKRLVNNEIREIFHEILSESLNQVGSINLLVWQKIQELLQGRKKANKRQRSTRKAPVASEQNRLEDLTANNEGHIEFDEDANVGFEFESSNDEVLDNFMDFMEVLKDA